MNPFREMLLVSVSDYNRMRKQLLVQHSELQKDLQEVSNIYGDDIPLDQKQKLQAEVISKHKILPESEAPPQTLPPLDDQLLKLHFDSFAKSNKTRSIQVYNHLKTYKPRWNSSGQFMSVNDKPIPNSNIVELINSVTTTKRSKNIPAGFGEFVAFLSDSNVPRNFLSIAGQEKINKLNNLVEENAEMDGHGNWITVQ